MSKNDAELEQRIYAEIPVMLAGKGLTEEQYNAIMNDRKESVELIMRHVTAYAERQSLLARSDELEHTDKKASHYRYLGMPMTVEDRLKQLTAQLNTLDKGEEAL